MSVVVFAGRDWKRGLMQSEPVAREVNTPATYLGSGPYCYANSVAMAMGAGAPGIGLLETVTGSPFGMQILGDALFFDPRGWTPEIGIDEALDALGWTATKTAGAPESAAIARLRAACGRGPVVIGPLEMGHLRHQPGMNGPIGADHYVLVLDVDDEGATVHDPQGYPFARIALPDLLAAWRAESIDYGQPFTMYTEFVRVREVGEAEAVTACLPAAHRRLTAEPTEHADAGAALGLARMLDSGCDPGLRGLLTGFSVRAGARRAADAASCLERAGYGEAAAIAGEQARLIGSLQRALVVGEDAAAAAALRRLAPTYSRLGSAIGAVVNARQH